MGRRKGEASDVSAGNRSGATSAKKSAAKIDAEGTGRELKRLRKGNVTKETPTDVLRKQEEAEVEQGFGRFQYFDEEDDGKPKTSRSKAGGQQQEIGKFLTASGKTSRKDKQEVAQLSAARREEKRNKRKQREQESDDDFDLAKVALDDDDDDYLDVEDSDDELMRKINNQQKKKIGQNASNGEHSNQIKTRNGSKLSPHDMDIEEVEVVRGKKESNSKEKPKAIHAAIKPEKEKRAPSQNKDPTPVKTAKKDKGKKGDSDDEDTFTKGPLSGMVIVLTGMFVCTGGDNKEELIETIKIMGAKSTGSVSKKTSLLVAGYKLPDGRETSTSTKYRTAKEKNVKIMTEDEFQELLKEKTGMTLLELINGGAKELALKDFELNGDIKSEKPSSGNPMDIEGVPVKDKAREFKSTKMVDERISPEIQGPVDVTALWTEKYAPRTVKEIIGNKGVIDKLREWIKSWDDVVIYGHKKETKWKGGFMGGGASVDNPNARAALISGSPGIGKTTTVRLLCKELGFNLIEQNASDMRNKNAVKGTFSSLGDSMTLTFSGDVAKTIILMDEVDGMSSDRGGTAALNEFIKKTKVPVICICNDRSHPKMRTLAGNCYDLKFIKPAKPLVVDRVAKILHAEVKSRLKRE
jgi:replication factor C subunit 1